MFPTHMNSPSHAERRGSWFNVNDQSHMYAGERENYAGQNTFNSKQMDYVMRGSTNGHPFITNGAMMEQKMNHDKQQRYGRDYVLHVKPEYHDYRFGPTMKTFQVKNHNNAIFHKKEEDTDDEEEEEYSSDDDHNVKNGALMELKTMNHEKHGHDSDHVLQPKPVYHDYRFGPNMAMKSSQVKNHNNAMFHKKEEDDDDDEEEEEYSSEEEESSDEELVENMRRMGTIDKHTKLKGTMMW